MKYLLMLLVSVSAHAHAGADYADIAKYGPPKLYFDSRVEVIDKNNFFYSCKGRVTCRDSLGQYVVEGLCDDLSTEHFNLDQLKIVKQQ